MQKPSKKKIIIITCLVVILSVESNAQEYLELARDNYETYLQLTGNQGYGMINN